MKGGIYFVIVNAAIRGLSENKYGGGVPISAERGANLKRLKSNGVSSERDKHEQYDSGHLER
jgi:hypothetical protein